MTRSKARTVMHGASVSVNARRPFNRLLTWWKPSHFFTGLEHHCRTASWRSFREGEAVIVVRATTSTTVSGVDLDIFADRRIRSAHLEEVVERVRRGYGLDEDLRPFLTALRDSHALQPREIRRLAGMRQSCPESIFEVAVVALILQNTTVSRSTQMMASLLDTYGQLIECPNGPTLKAFFTAEEIAGASEASLRTVNRLGYRAAYLPRFAAAFNEGQADRLAATGRPELMNQLLAIHGVGPYTAGVIASTALRDHSAFGIDVWNRPILSSRLLGAPDASADEVREVCIRRFGEYAGLAVLYIVENHFIHHPVVPLAAKMNRDG